MKQRTPGRSIQPPSAISRSSMITGRPGAQVICSTGRFWSSQVLALISSSVVPTLIGGMRALTLLAGHSSRVGTKM